MHYFELQKIGWLSVVIGRAVVLGDCSGWQKEGGFCFTRARQWLLHGGTHGSVGESA